MKKKLIERHKHYDVFEIYNDKGVFLYRTCVDRIPTERENIIAIEKRVAAARETIDKPTPEEMDGAQKRNPILATMSDELIENVLNQIKSNVKPSKIMESCDISRKQYTCIYDRHKYQQTKLRRQQAKESITHFEPQY